MKKFKCILLVDDDSNTTLLAKQFLESMNIAEQIHITSGGQEAIDFIGQNNQNNNSDGSFCPDVIFLDIIMPGMDGFEFINILRENFKTLSKKMKIFIVSSSDDSEHMKKAINLNVHGYIVKPLTKEKIITTLLNGLFIKETE